MIFTKDFYQNTLDKILGQRKFIFSFLKMGNKESMIDEKKLEIDSLTNLEDDFVKEGFLEGIDDGKSQGFVEGENIGFVKGFELSYELGFYLGTVQLLKKANLKNEKSQNITQILKLESLIEKMFDKSGYLILENLDNVQKIRNNFKSICSKLAISSHGPKNIPGSDKFTNLQTDF